MNPSGTDTFGQPLVPDPKIALPRLPPRILHDAPMQRVQFLIEFVGTTPIPAAMAANLLRAAWYGALGKPEVFVLRPGEPSWIRLVPTGQGSYDSVMVAWNYLSPQGHLTEATARHLLTVTEQFFGAFGRRAVPLTPVRNVSNVAAALMEVSNRLDVGCSLVVIPNGASFLERDVWIACASLGLTFSPEGTFDWVVQGHPYPVLSVTPIGSSEAFSLRAVNAGESHQGLTVGFRLATCPAADVAVQGAYHVIDYLCGALGGVAFDDSQRPLQEAVRVQIKRDISTAIGMLTRAGLAPGTPEAIRVFTV